MEENKSTAIIQEKTDVLNDCIGNMAVGVVKYVLPQGVLCELIREER